MSLQQRRANKPLLVRMDRRKVKREAVKLLVAA